MTTDDVPFDEAVPPPAADGLSPDVRRRLVEQFEAWLDRAAAAGEPPPAGIPCDLLAEVDPAPPGGDLYSVVAGLTALAGEVRIQGRTFKGLAEVLAPVVDLPRQVQALADALAPPTEDPDAVESADDSALPSATAVLEVLLDLYDRLGRGLRAAEAALAAPPSTVDVAGWFGRRQTVSLPSSPSADAVRAMRDGYALTLSRVEAALHGWDVEPIGKPGEPFDPRRMVAMDVRPRGDGPADVVAEVARTGAAVRGAVLTLAQVTVTR